MPKNKLQMYLDSQKGKGSGNRKPPPSIDVNYISSVIRQYMKANKITSEQIAAVFQCSGANVRYLLNRPAAKWTLQDLFLIADFVNCPRDQILKAADLSISPIKRKKAGSNKRLRQ